MNPPGPTTFRRMRETAYEKMRDLEMSHDARCKLIGDHEPHPETATTRDDLFGLVRLMDVILMDEGLVAEMKRRLR